MLGARVCPVIFLFPPDRRGLLDFTLQSAFAMLLHHPPTQYPKQLASGSCRLSRQSSPMDPAELLASGSRPVSRQSGSPVGPAEYPARAARQWIPPSIPPNPARVARQWILPSIPPEQLASVSRPVSCQSCSPVDPAEYPARAARQSIPLSIPPERLASSSPEQPASKSRRVSR